MTNITDRYASQRKLPPATELAKEYAAGLSFKDLAAKYGVSESGVDAAFRRAGIKVRGTRSPAVRFWPKVNKRGPIPDYAPHLGPCWLWTGADDGNGYGHFRGANGRTVKAYKMAYELTHGTGEEGKQLDHLCRVTMCVNPGHLEPVTQKVNILRGTSHGAIYAMATHCIRGHEFTDENTIINSVGGRNCKACRPIYWERQRNRKKQQTA